MIVLVLLCSMGQPLLCADEARQLFPIALELLGPGGAVLWDSRSAGAADGGHAKLCHSYPLKNMSMGTAFTQKGWQGFNDLSRAALFRGAAAPTPGRLVAPKKNCLLRQA